MQTFEAIRDAKCNEFVRLVRIQNEKDCLEYIAKYDGFYDATVDMHDRMNMLQLACTYKLDQLAIALIDKKCNLTHQDNGGFTALAYASYHDLTHVVTYIIDKLTDRTTRTTLYLQSEMMYLCDCSRDTKSVIKMIDCGYDIYYKNHRNESLFTVAINCRAGEIIIKLIDIDTDFIKEFNTLYTNPKCKKNKFHHNITKYCVGKYDAYKCEIIATMNDASPTNMLYQSFRTIYAVKLVDIICDFILLRM
ncbi:MAG: hypothetical protein Faunusvirus13_17 [Faunusvirus sp.]|jgi:hypothetical protein|uniref:Uncharacterized protein n=1 Tax=Faunusvirus sp. TaxID=2487766 RepID=A0A3G4ZYN0_9VIRU|nr:MAG: hypothetical protein Faunusvirus13_17 [Faunusvirus sp.]